MFKCWFGQYQVNESNGHRDFFFFFLFFFFFFFLMGVARFYQAADGTRADKAAGIHPVLIPQTDPSRNNRSQVTEPIRLGEVEPQSDVASHVSTAQNVLVAGGSGREKPTDPNARCLAAGRWRERGKTEVRQAPYA